MKFTTILSALTLAAPGLSSSVQADDHDQVKELLARKIDPQTMDPTRLSVLAVIKSAMPPDAPMPTGGSEPKWYQDIPADVMIILAQLYPAEPTTDVSATSALATGSTSAADGFSSSQATSDSTTTNGPPLKTPAMEVTMSSMPMTGTGGISASITATPSNGTLPSATRIPVPSDSSVPSAGTRVPTIRADTLATILGVGVGACFFLFA